VKQRRSIPFGSRLINSEILLGDSPSKSTTREERA
jgi:hypothetical protein